MAGKIGGRERARLVLEDLEQGLSGSEIEAKYSISRKTLYNIKNGRTYGKPLKEKRGPVEVDHAFILDYATYVDGKLIRNRDSENGTFKAGREIGSPNEDGYIRTKIYGKHFFVHNLIWLYHTASFPPEGLYVDHINLIKDDNRMENFRLLTIASNTLAASVRPSSRNTSGTVGVCKEDNGYVAYISIGGQRERIRCESLEEAVLKRAELEIKYNVEFNVVGEV